MSRPQPVPGIPDATLQWVDALPERLANGHRYSAFGEVEGDVALLHAPGMGRCRISHGRTIELWAEKTPAAPEVQRFLTKDATLALVHQRGELPLHGSSVVSPSGKLAIFCGASGMGKSTMAAELQRRGWTFFADDLTRIRRSGDAAMAYPGPSEMRLLPDAWRNVQGLQAPSARVSGDGKVVLAVRAATSATAVSMIVMLGGTEPSPRLEPLTGSAAVAAVMGNVPGPGKLKAFGNVKQQLSLVELLLADTTVVRLHGRATTPARGLATFVADSLEA